MVTVALQSANWEECFNSGNIDEGCSGWTEKILNIARMFIPNKMVLIIPRDKPWFTNELRLMRRKVRRLCDKAKRSNSDYHWERHKTSQTEYKTALDEAEKRYKQNLNSKQTNNRN